MVAGRFDAARLSIDSRFHISERHLRPIVTNSPFVPLDEVGFATLGITRIL